MGEQSSGSNGGWWGGWLQAAKDKSNEAMTFIKRDLEEFSSVVSTDTKNLVATTANSIREKMALPDSEETPPSSDSGTAAQAIVETSGVSPGPEPPGFQQLAEAASVTGNYVSKGLSSLLTSVSQALTIPPDDDDGDPIVFREDGMIFDRASARLHCLRVDPSTYTEEPETKHSDAYERWLDANDLEGQKSQIATLLVDCPEIRAHYTQMVPSTISHAQFWSRYFFKVELLEADEKRREALKARADVSSEPIDEVLGWGDEDEDVTSATQPSTPPTSTVLTPPLSTALTPTLPEPLSMSSSSAPLSPVEVDAVLRLEDERRREVAESALPMASTDVDAILSVELEAPASSDVNAILSVELEVPASSDVVASTYESPSSSSELPFTSPLDSGISELDTPSPAETKGTSLTPAVDPSKKKNTEPNENAAEITVEDAEVEDTLSDEIKGLVVVDGIGAERAKITRTTPTPPSSKESGASGDDWEKELELELTPEEHKMAEGMLKPEEDWENWE